MSYSMTEKDKGQTAVIPRFGDYDYEENESRFKRKIRENPFVPIGLAGAVGIVGYNIYNIFLRKNKSKSKYPLSLQVIHTRMYAQGFVVSLLAVGMFYTLGKRVYKIYISPESKNNKSD